MRSIHRTTLFLAIAAALVSTGGVATAQTPEPYRDPPFACDVIDYGTDPPPVPGPDGDPLCVRYDKTNVTISTLEAVDFLAAEPGRITIVAGKCSFWQQDEWAIRAAPETPPLVSWKGSYWYDATSGAAAGILRDLRVADQPASGEVFIEAMRPIVGDEQADAFTSFTDEGGGGGLTMSLPEGFAYEDCAAGAGDGGPDDADPDDGEEDPADEPSSLPSDASAGTTPDAAARLPATGAPMPLVTVLVMVAGGIALRGFLRRPSTP